MTQCATENIRTVAWVGDGGAGKTTLVEALLAKAGAVQAAGSVERGSTVSDFDPLEKTYQHSLRASLVHLETDGTRIHMVALRRGCRSANDNHSHFYCASGHRVNASGSAGPAHAARAATATRRSYRSFRARCGALGRAR